MMPDNIDVLATVAALLSEMERLRLVPRRASFEAQLAAADAWLGAQIESGLPFVPGVLEALSHVRSVLLSV